MSCVLTGLFVCSETGCREESRSAEHDSSANEASLDVVGNTVLNDRLNINNNSHIY